MYCKYCGNEIADDSVFCAKCGKNVIEDASADKTKGDISDDSPDPENVNASASNNIPEMWYYWDGTEMGGPIGVDELRDKLQSHRIDYEAKVRNNLNVPWVALVDSPFADIALKLRPEPVSISDKWIWCLAVVPLAVTMLLSYLNIIQTNSALSWIIPFAANIAFFLLDKKELQEKGFYPEKWMWLGVFIIPVYLVVREVKTNCNFIPAIIWCFLGAVEVFIL